MSDFVFDQEAAVEAWRRHLNQWLEGIVPLTPVHDFLVQQFVSQFIEHHLSGLMKEHGLG